MMMRTRCVVWGGATGRRGPGLVATPPTTHPRALSYSHATSRIPVQQLQHCAWPCGLRRHRSQRRLSRSSSDWLERLPPTNPAPQSDGVRPSNLATLLRKKARCCFAPIAGNAGLVIDNSHLFANQTIEQCGFADIGASGDGNCKIHYSVSN